MHCQLLQRATCIDQLEDICMASYPDKVRNTWDCIRSRSTCLHSISIFACAVPCSLVCPHARHISKASISAMHICMAHGMHYSEVTIEDSGLYMDAGMVKSRSSS